MPDQEMAKAPVFFSVVIPMYNREAMILRALRSVLDQDCGDFEVIVVDDGSTDASVSIVSKLSDTRIRLVRHAANRGVCPARNTGVDHAWGEWVVFLDSDDELLPGALTYLRERATGASPEIGRLASRYRWDDGGISPDPMPASAFVDYEGYLRWIETVRRGDFHNCVRRSTFEHVRLPDSRAYEGIYHLDFARRFPTLFLSEVVALEHQDARNGSQGSSLRARVRASLRDARDGMDDVERILEVHGDELFRSAKTRWQEYQRLRVVYPLLAGERLRGLRAGWNYGRRCGFSLSVCAAIVIGLVGRSPLAYARALRRTFSVLLRSGTTLPRLRRSGTTSGSGARP